MQYRYPGPKPKSREVAIVMLADAVEGATRTMSEPTASRIETLVHELAMRRLLDGQFDECDLTMRELELIERSLAKTLLGIYHGRITYPSTSNLTASPTPTIARTA
jgi:membrane-associated HD superfamily phosphohydrolase